MKNRETKTYISLKILTEELNPDEISSVLGIKYDKGWKKGEKIINPKGNWYGKNYDFSCWIYNSKLYNSLNIDDLQKIYGVFFFH